jgi:hypothetical protein
VTRARSRRFRCRRLELAGAREDRRPGFFFEFAPQVDAALRLHTTLGHDLYDENLGIIASRVRRPILPSR